MAPMRPDDVEQVVRFALDLEGSVGVLGDVRMNLDQVMAPTKKCPKWARLTLLLPPEVGRAFMVPAEEAEWDLIFMAVPRTVVAEMRRRRDSRVLTPGQP